MLKRALLFIFVFNIIFSKPSLFAQATANPQIEQHPRLAQVSDKIQAKVDELAEELNLTAEQQAKIKEILENSTEEIKGILQATKDKAKEIRVKAHDEVMNLLTQEQRDKFKVTRKKHEAAP